MKFKVGDVVDIKEECYEHGYARWFKDSRTGLTITRVDDDCISNITARPKTGTIDFHVQACVLEHTKEKEMRFKAGDIVDLTAKGIEEYGHFFKDGVYTELEIVNIDSTGGYLVSQNDKQDEWFVDDSSLEFSKETWRRNTPIFVNYDGDWRPRHYSHTIGGRIYFYPYGKTSFSYKGKSASGYRDIKDVRKATAEELK